MTGNKVAGDKIIAKKLSSGMKCYIIPKAGYQTKMAAICVGFGSNDIMFNVSNIQDNYISPQGTAHFIEHKLFEQEWGDAFSAFAENGASANAFTDFHKTAYYFSCSDHFNENLALLLRFVQNPHFTAEGTNKEKKIIGSEITMYDDEPTWIVYFNLLKALYHHHPIQYPIAGTIQTIEQIDKDVLQFCYDAFYVPENFSLVCVGDVDEDEILAQVEGSIQKNKKQRAVTCSQNEPNSIVQTYIEQKMGITSPVFQIGFKETNESTMDVKKEIAIGIALDILAGEGSEFLKNAYEKNILEESIGFQYLYGDGFAFTAFSGKAKEPNQVNELLIQEIERIKQQGIPQSAFERVQKKQIGRMVRGMNSINAICMSQLELGMKDVDLFERFQLLKRIRKEDVEQILKESFQRQQMALSVVK